MLNEEAVKQFFLETSEWVVKENPMPILNTHFPHSLGLLHNNGYLYYIDIWAEVEKENIIQSIGHILIWHQPGPLWGINYDGWHKKNEKIISLRKQGLIKTFRKIDQQWKQIIFIEENGFKYENKANGSFSFFELEETITNYFNCLSYYHYRGRALVNLSS